MSRSRSAPRAAPRAGARSAAASPASLPLPKYHQIYLVLRQQLEEGRFNAGLPPETELTSHFGVGRVTVRRALEQLANEGLIVRTAGRGTRPTSRSEREQPGGAGLADTLVANANTRLTGLLENLVQVSRSNLIKVLEWRLIPANDALAQALQLAPGTPVRKVVRRRSTAAGPVSFITSYLPTDRVKGFGRAELARKPMLQLLSESGVEWGRARQTVTARQADAEVATQLDVTIGTALLSVRRLVYDVDDRPVQMLHGLYRPDRYEYQMELSRVGGIDARIVTTELSP